jgi:hypothetical protein
LNDYIIMIIKEFNKNTYVIIDKNNYVNIKNYYINLLNIKFNKKQHSINIINEINSKLIQIKH